MFGQNPNAMNNGPQCNTYLRPMTSEQSMLSPSLWNQNLSIRIRPAIGRDGNGIVQYDKNRQGQTALSPENCRALISKFNEEIRPGYEAAIRDKLPCDVASISVVSGGASKNVTTIRMRPGNDPEDMTPVMELEVALNVDANGVAAEGNIYRHEFAKKMVFLDYSPTTGPKGKSSVNADFETFLAVIEAIGSNTSMENSVAKHQEKYDAMRAAEYQNNSGSSNGGGFGSGGMFSGMNNPGQSQGNGFGIPSNGELPFN